MCSDNICHLKVNVETMSVSHLSHQHKMLQSIRAEVRKKWPRYLCKVVFLEPVGGSCLDSQRTGLWMSLTWIGGPWSPSFSLRCRLTHTCSTPTTGLCGSLLESHMVQGRGHIVKADTDIRDTGPRKGHVVEVQGHGRLQIVMGFQSESTMIGEIICGSL